MDKKQEILYREACQQILKDGKCDAVPCRHCPFDDICSSSPCHFQSRYAWAQKWLSDHPYEVELEYNPEMYSEKLTKMEENLNNKKTEMIQIEIPAPPDGWVYDGMRCIECKDIDYILHYSELGWQETTDPAWVDAFAPIAVKVKPEKQELPELPDGYEYKELMVDMDTKEIILKGEYREHSLNHAHIIGFIFEDEPETIYDNYRRFKSKDNSARAILIHQLDLVDTVFAKWAVWRKS